jgi:hypothetical protein
MEKSGHKDPNRTISLPDILLRKKSLLGLNLLLKK